MIMKKRIPEMERKCNSERRCFNAALLAKWNQSCQFSIGVPIGAPTTATVPGHDLYAETMARIMPIFVSCTRHPASTTDTSTSSFTDPAVIESASCFWLSFFFYLPMFYPCHFACG